LRALLRQLALHVVEPGVQFVGTLLDVRGAIGNNASAEELGQLLLSRGQL
jgi:hypothetical protein